MLKEREHVISKLNQAMQTAISVGAFALSSMVYHFDRIDELLASRDFSIYIMLVGLSGWIAIDHSGLHRMNRETNYYELLYRYAKVTTIGSGLLCLARVILHTNWFNYEQIALFALLNFVLLYLFKASFFGFMRLMRRKGFNTRQLLLVADGSSRSFIDDLLKTKDWGYRIWGVVTASRSLKKRYDHRLQMLDSKLQVDQLLDETVIDEVIYAKSKLDYDEINRLMLFCAERGIVFRLRPGVIDRFGLKPKFTVFNNNPLVVFRNIPGNYLALKVKRGIDIAVTLFALMLFSPMLLMVALAIKLDDGGPIFFVQERVGLYGRRFGCMKFRTMVTNAEALKSALMAQNEQDGPVFKMKGDPRITRIGKFLRKYSVDEFPQFLNVLKGDMSVVGPRPPIPNEVSQYRNNQNRRLSMKPGITCLWQVSGRNNIDFDNWVRLDTKYIDNWSLRLDLMIILKTVKVMVKGDGM
ncbi:sugar transferase [Mangrovibacterium sp.]|uniref:sugar transferase n=1 Tax=Mangrovibacterium sp. TaxID=1961364 RepID=UPI0035640426